MLLWPRYLRMRRFFAVAVRNEAPDELVNLVGYLAAIADKVLIDLVTVSAYSVAGSQILVPQRVDPEYQQPQQEPSPFAPVQVSKGRFVEGADDFAASIGDAKPEQQAVLRQLCDWARSLEKEGLVRLHTYHHVNAENLTLLPRLRAPNVGLVTIWHQSGNGVLQFWRKVFEKRAPHGLKILEDMGVAVSNGNNTKEITSQLLEELTSCYREAATGRIAAE